LRVVPLSRDGDFTWDLFIDRYNADLANDWGNLFTRTVSMIHRYREGRVGAPSGDAFRDMEGLIADALRDYSAAMERYEIDKGIEAAWSIIRRGNRLVEEKAPWNLAKDPARAADLDALLATLVVALQHTALLLYPVMPAKAREVWETLRLSPSIDAVRLPKAGSLLPSPSSPEPLGASKPLFPRIER
jgi:methionyl-tRNA synthetase